MEKSENASERPKTLVNSKSHLLRPATGELQGLLKSVLPPEKPRSPLLQSVLAGIEKGFDTVTTAQADTSLEGTGDRNNVVVPFRKPGTPKPYEQVRLPTEPIPPAVVIKLRDTVLRLVKSEGDRIEQLLAEERQRFKDLDADTEALLRTVSAFIERLHESESIPKDREALWNLFEELLRKERTTNTPS